MDFCYHIMKRFNPYKSTQILQYIKHFIKKKHVPRKIGISKFLYKWRPAGQSSITTKTFEALE